MDSLSVVVQQHARWHLCRRDGHSAGNRQARRSTDVAGGGLSDARTISIGAVVGHPPSTDRSCLDDRARASYSDSSHPLLAPSRRCRMGHRQGFRPSGLRRSGGIRDSVSDHGSPRWWVSTTPLPGIIDGPISLARRTCCSRPPCHRRVGADRSNGISNHMIARGGREST